MRFGSLMRAFMIVVGITATIVIVLSQALPGISTPSKEKAKIEQTESNTESKVAAAPSDVVPGGIIQMNSVDRSLLETIDTEEIEVSEFKGYVRVLSGYFNILFRAIISPNAP